MEAVFETRHAGGSALDAHRHREGYVALVMQGRYCELSADGRFDCGPDTLVVHPPFHAHANRFGSGDAVNVLNVRLPSDQLPGAARTTRVSRGDADTLHRLIRRDPRQAARVVVEEIAPPAPRVAGADSWIDRLIAALHNEDGRSIAELARAAGVSAEHASRQIAGRIGLTPRRIRQEARLRRALQALAEGTDLVDTAIAAGYCDQSHMCRAFRRMLGRTPGDVATEMTAD